MKQVKNLVSPAKIFGVIVLSTFLLSNFLPPDDHIVRAQEIATSTPIPVDGIQPLNSGAFYYYVDGSRAPLTLSTEWVSVKFVSDDSESQSAALDGFNATLATENGLVEISNPKITLVPLRDGLQRNSLIAGMNSMRANQTDFTLVNPVFHTQSAEMVVTDQFIATFSGAMNIQDINAVNAFHGVKIVEPILGQPKTFVLEMTDAAPLDALGMANLYVESGLVVSAAPNFARIKFSNLNPNSNFEPSFTPNDTYYSDSWHLNNTGQFNSQPRGQAGEILSGLPSDADIDAPEAWDIITGDPSIVIAILDEGVDLAHEDLAANLVAGYDATDAGSAGAATGDDAHGTATAGLAAAVGNSNEGVTGVCPNCKIMPVRIAYSVYYPGYGWAWNTYDAWIADGIAWAYQNGASILSNSWGGGAPSTVINTAFTNAVTLGRGGLGSVVVVASGNDNILGVEYPANLSNVIAVGASNLCDQRKSITDNACNAYEEWWGSNYGPELDISAPGVLLDTADITGTAGYNGGNYDLFFNGTSGATPIVAGVAGLVLSANPYITATQVQTILQDNADDVNSGTLPGWDQELGYGRVNANAALQAAITGYNPINVIIGGPTVGKYYLPDGQSRRVNYDSLDSGPVKVQSTNGANIIAAIREAWAVNGVTTSFSQLMGLPSSQVSDKYVFPAYNNVTLNEQLRIGNVNSTNAPSTVTVTIGGVLQGTYTLQQNEAVRINYAGLDSGPVVVDGTDGVDIISSIREAWAVNGVTRSFVQVMGLPATQLSDKYVFPAYNNVTLNEQLRIGNVNSTNVPSTVTVTIGGVLRGTYTLQQNEAIRINYAGLDSGPVVVDGTDGVDIISSIRDAWAVNGVTTSFSQLMGLPAGQLSDQYIFPAYNNVTLNEQLRIGNVNSTNVPTTVTVTIGGVLRGTYTLQQNEAVRVNYAGVDSGPVVIQGTAGVDIIAAIREAWAVNGVTQSFVQLMGLPFSQLSTSYLFPAYNNVTLNEQLRFAVP